jgi:WW domain-binding protein 2
MALNWTMLKPDRTPEPLPGELTIMTVEPGAEVSLAVPDTPPTGSSPSGGSGGARKLNGTGKLYLTDQRVRFSVADSVSEKLIRNPGLLVDFRL